MTAPPPPRRRPLTLSAERRAALLEAAALRGQATVRSRAERLTERRWPIIQTAVAAGLAWWVATRVLHHATPAFAPIAAVVAIGETLSHRRRRAVELLCGVSVGIGTGDVLANLIGTGPVQLAFVIVLAMTTATVLGGGALVVAEAAVLPVLVVVSVRADPGISPTRFLDAITGCGIAYGVAVLFPRNVGRTVEGAADPLFASLADLLDQVSVALARGDEDLAAGALADVEAADEQHERLSGTIADVQAEVRFAPGGQRARRKLRAYAGAAPQAARILRNVHTLSRASLRLLRDGRTAPATLSDAVSDLAWAVRLLPAALLDPDYRDETVAVALRASDEAALAAHADPDLALGIVVDIVRACAFDVMRAAGLSADEAEAFLSELNV